MVFNEKFKNYPFVAGLAWQRAEASTWSLPVAPPQALESQADLFSRSPITPSAPSCSCGGQHSLHWLNWEQMSIIMSVLIKKSSQSALKRWISQGQDKPVICVLSPS